MTKSTLILFFMSLFALTNTARADGGAGYILGGAVVGALAGYILSDHDDQEEQEEAQTHKPQNHGAKGQGERPRVGIHGGIGRHGPYIGGSIGGPFYGGSITGYPRGYRGGFYGNYHYRNYGNSRGHRGHSGRRGH